MGFPPARAKARIQWLKHAAGITNTFTFFEAPHRIRQTLLEATGYFGKRPISVARELTKLHQEIIRGDIEHVIGQLTEPRGEFTVVVGPVAPTAPPDTEVSDTTLVAEFCRMPETMAGTRRERVSSLARKYGRSTRDVYALIERAKKSGN